MAWLEDARNGKTCEDAPGFDAPDEGDWGTDD